MNNKKAIAYIESIMGAYENPIKESNTNPKYRLCPIWLSERDMLALKMGIEALREREDEHVPTITITIEEYMRLRECEDKCRGGRDE